MAMFLNANAEKSFGYSRNEMDGQNVKTIIPKWPSVHRITNVIRAAIDERRKSEERFRLLVEGVKDYAIFMLDSKGIVVSWNLGAERIKGAAT
jgi:hypothetical protein